MRAEILSTRFGYGLPLPAGSRVTPEAMLALLAGPDLAQAAWPLPLMPEALVAIQTSQRLKQAERGTTEDKGFKASLRVQYQQVEQAVRATLARALDSPDGFRERLVAFWTNHFCTRTKDGVSSYLPALMVEEAIRPHVAGKFADMLVAATTHPAMVLYLDQDISFGPNSKAAKRRKQGLNENLGREVIELHSLGVAADYTQTDVTQMALLLTGLTFAPQLDGAIFDPTRAEPGPKTVLGKTYDGKGLAPIRAALRDLAARPETARHIASKLAVHFIAEDPPRPMVEAMTRAYLATDGDLMAVYRVMLNRPAAEAAPLTKVRWPSDYMITGFRALGLSGADVMALGAGTFRRQVIRSMAAMGMPWFRPAGPNGFSEAAGDWINPPFLAARIAWSMTMPNAVLGTKGALQPALDPRALVDQVLGTRVSPALRQAVGRAETRPEALGLILASAELNRR